VVGRLQREGEVIHLVAERLTDLTARLNALTETVFSENGMARADEVRRNSADPRLEPKFRPGRAAAAIPKPRDFR
jgi:error-prone DNA polymerase